MKEINISLDSNFSNDNYNSMFLLSISVLGLLALNFASYKFQKDFSNINKPSKLIVGFLATIILLLGALATLTFSDIANLNKNNNESQALKNFINNTNYTQNPITNKNTILDFNNAETNINKNIINNNINKNNNLYAIEASKNLIFILSIFNLFFYILLPLIFFYLTEEKNYNEANSSSSAAENLYSTQRNTKNATENDDCENLLLNIDSHEINSVHFHPCEFDYMQILKNYSFYLTAFTSLNIIYLVLFKTSILNSANSIELYSFIPEAMRNYSTLASDFEILSSLNFLVIWLCAKLALLVYLPYGLGKLTASLISNLHLSQELKNEYNNLNSGFNKNFEVIKQITTQKLMTGKSLSKQEKNIMRLCREKQTRLEHKQEVLQEKYSKIKAVLFYVSFPLKFFAVIFSVLISLLLLVSKASSTYARLRQSECGVSCGFFADKVANSIGLQNIWEFVLTHSQKVFGIPSAKFVMLITALLYVYLLMILFVAFRELGLLDLNKIIFSPLKSFIIKKPFKVPFVKTIEIRSDKMLSLVFYSLFFFAAVAAIAENLSFSPSVSYYMEHYKDCSVKLINNSECKFSAYMLFTVKNSVNFSFWMIIGLGIDLVATLFTAFFIVFLPVKALMNFFKPREQKNQGEEEDEEYLNCC